MASPASLPEPRHELRAAAAGPEQGGEEAEGAVDARELAPRAQRLAAAPRRRIARSPHGAASAACSDSSSARSAAMRMRSSSVRPTSGDFSAVASVRSSSRQQRRAARRHEIEHGDVLADIEPVGAGHRHARLLEGADHRLEGGAALAHQHEHVAGLPDAAHLVALGGPALHRLRDAARDDHGRRMLLGLVDGQDPGLRLLLLGGRLDGPQFHEARRMRARALVHGADGLVLEGQALEMPRRPRRSRRPPRARLCRSGTTWSATRPRNASSASRTFCDQLRRVVSNSWGAAPWKP